MPSPARQILLVEDEPTLQKVFDSVLGDAGHTIETVGSAEQAIERLSHPPAQDFDLVLCDKNLPAMNGLDLLDHVRAQDPPDAGHQRFVLVTGYPSRESAMRVFNAGGDGYLVKPFRSLRAAVDELQHILDQNPQIRHRGHCLAHQVIAAVTGEAVTGLNAEVSVQVKDPALQHRLHTHLQLAGATVVTSPTPTHPGRRALIAERAADVAEFARTYADGAMVLVSTEATFQDVLTVIHAGGGRTLDPTLVGATP